MGKTTYRFQDQPHNNVVNYDDTEIKNRLSKLESKPDNDKQTLSINNRIISISNGNSIELPVDKDTIYDDSDVKRRITTLERKTDNDKQTLTLNGRRLIISNGNSVELPEETLDGGDNLICNSAFPENTDGWGVWELLPNVRNPKLLVYKHGFYYNNTKNLFVLKADTNDGSPASTNRFPVKRNTTYSLNISMFGTDNIKKVLLYFLGRKSGETTTFSKVVTVKEITGSPSTTNLVRYYCTFNTGESDEGFIRIDNGGKTNSSPTSDLYFTEVDVYEGTSPRAWQMSTNCLKSLIDSKVDNDKQMLSIVGNNISISNGNTISLPKPEVSLQEFVNLKNEFNNVKRSLDYILNNLKNSGAWNQTGNTIFEGSLKPNRNIATGNINIFGGTVDGNTFIRTNNSNTENDLAGGMN